jgi:hypothetical protein
MSRQVEGEFELMKPAELAGPLFYFTLSAAQSEGREYNYTQTVTWGKGQMGKGSIAARMISRARCLPHPVDLERHKVISVRL